VEPGVIGELKKGFLHHIAASTEPEKFARLPRRDEMKFLGRFLRPYLHQQHHRRHAVGYPSRNRPQTGPEARNVPLVADMSSDIASRPIEVKKYGVIFAGAQKI